MLARWRTGSWVLVCPAFSGTEPVLSMFPVVGSLPARSPNKESSIPIGSILTVGERPTWNKQQARFVADLSMGTPQERKFRRFNVECFVRVRFPSGDGGRIWDCCSLQSTHDSNGAPSDQNLSRGSRSHSEGRTIRRTLTRNAGSHDTQSRR